MKIVKYLKLSHISADIKASDKNSVIQSLVALLVEQGQVPGDMAEDIMSAVLERESLTSTGLGSGVALPHVKTDVVKQICVAFGRSNAGIEFEALDGNPVHFFFLILAPTKATDDYLKILSSISGMMKMETVRAQLREAKSAEEIYRILDRPV